MLEDVHSETLKLERQMTEVLSILKGKKGAAVAAAPAAHVGGGSRADALLAELKK
jgi:hypothetical protein